MVLIHPNIPAANSSLKSHQWGGPEPSLCLLLAFCQWELSWKGTRCPVTSPHHLSVAGNGASPSGGHWVLNKE